MLRIRSSLAARSLALFAVLSLTMPGCTAWKIKQTPPAELLAAKRQTEVRVTLADKKRIVITNPRIAGDSLVSSGVPASSADHGKPSRAAIALSDIRSVEVREFSSGRTVLLIVGLGLTIAAIALGIEAGNELNDMSSMPQSSCPLLYSWDGSAWRLDSGTYGGAIQQPLARTDVDNLEHATATDGLLKLRLTDEASETEFVDAVSVTAVDHAPNVQVAPDGRGILHAYEAPALPIRARDFGGRDATARVVALDGWSWESLLRQRDLNDPAELQDGLEVEFARPAGDGAACLVLDAHDTPWVANLVATYARAHGREEPAWQEDARAHPADARREMARLMADGMLEASIWTEGGWQRLGAFWEAGPEVVKRQVLPIDLTHAAGKTVRVRLSAIPSFWLIDQVALATLSSGSLTATELSLTSASDSTRHDLRTLLADVDGREYLMKTGSNAELKFRVPPVPQGKARTYLARTTGWYRIDCDTTRVPDRALLDRVALDTGSAAHISIEMMNAALRAMAAAGQ